MEFNPWERGLPKGVEAKAPLGGNPPPREDLAGEPLRGTTSERAFHRNRIRRLSSVPGAGTEVLYAALEQVLNAAFDQAATGKGKDRHAGADEPFEHQFICEGQREFGIGGGLFQAVKKLKEGARFADRGERDRAVFEMRGAINYIAATIVVLEEGQ